MRASVGAALTVLLALVLLPVTGCTSLLGDFTSGPGAGDGGGADATMEDGGGDGQATDVTSGDGPGDSGGDASRCGPSNCGNGCCDPTGRCIAYVMQGASSCGTGGVACASCATGETCSNGACSCGGAVCNGCCNSAKKCVSPTTNMACGVNGAQCQTCASGQECSTQGQCVCNGTSCPMGCCTAGAGGSCVGYASESANQCGSGGASCVACTPPPMNGSATCTNGACAVSCSSGFSPCSGHCVNLQNDPANCGVCGRSCLGGQCSSATCLPYVLAQPPVTSTVMSIASDGTNLLWIDSGKSGVYQIPIAGGAITTLASGVSFSTPATGIAVANGKYAFVQAVSTPNLHVWTGTEGVANGAVQGTTAWPIGWPYGLAMTPDAQNVGFVEVLGSSNSADVYFVPAVNGTGAPIDSPMCSGTGCPLRAGQQVAANSTYFAWTMNVLTGINAGEVGLYNYVTHTKTYPSTTVLYPDFPLLDASYLYWVDNASLQIWRMTLPTGTPQLVMDNGSQTFTGLAEDGTYAYFTINGTSPGSVYYVSVSGTSAPVLLFSGGSPQQIIAAGGAIFWIDSSSWKIYGLRFP